MSLEEMNRTNCERGRKPRGEKKRCRFFIVFRCFGIGFLEGAFAENGVSFFPPAPYLQEGFLRFLAFCFSVVWDCCVVLLRVSWCGRGSGGEKSGWAEKGGCASVKTEMPREKKVVLCTREGQREKKRAQFVVGKKRNPLRTSRNVFTQERPKYFCSSGEKNGCFHEEPLRGSFFAAI